MAAQGAHNLPTIKTTDNVKEALQSLAEISSSRTKVRTETLAHIILAYSVTFNVKYVLISSIFHLGYTGAMDPSR